MKKLTRAYYLYSLLVVIGIMSLPVSARDYSYMDDHPTGKTNTSYTSQSTPAIQASRALSGTEHRQVPNERARYTQGRYERERGDKRYQYYRRYEYDRKYPYGYRSYDYRRSDNKHWNRGKHSANNPGNRYGKQRQKWDKQQRKEQKKRGKERQKYYKEQRQASERRWNEGRRHDKNNRH